jgi:hypothetical protein
MKSFKQILSETGKNYRNKRKARELGWTQADWDKFDRDPSYTPKSYGALGRFPLNLHKINLKKYKNMVDIAKSELNDADENQSFRTMDDVEFDGITQHFPYFPAKSDRRKQRLYQAIEKKFGSLKSVPEKHPLKLALKNAKNRSRRLSDKFDTDERQIRTLSGFIRDNTPGSTSRIQRREKK